MNLAEAQWLFNHIGIPVTTLLLSPISIEIGYADITRFSPICAFDGAKDCQSKRGIAE